MKRKSLPFELFKGNIRPYHKAQSANDNQCHQCQIHKPVSGIIPGKRRIRFLAAHQVKARVTKCGNRVEYAIIYAFCKAKTGNKPNGEQHSSHTFKQKRPKKYHAGELHNATNLQCIHTFLQQIPLPQTDSSAEKNGKADAYGDKAQSSDLNQRQNYKLPEQIPMCKGVIHHKPRHTGGTGCGKHRIPKIGPFSASGRNWKHQ